MKSSLTRIGVLGRRKFVCFFFYSGIALIFCLCLRQVSADVQSIDVEPAVKKEQPDFEDDTGSLGIGRPALHEGGASNPHGNIVGNVAVASGSGFLRHDGVIRNDGGMIPHVAMPAQRQDGLISRVSQAQSTVGASEAEIDISFMHAFAASLSIIIVSELGDKTFFISAIMAMSHPRMTVFAGAMVALAGMHVLSALFGFVITIVPRMYTFYASTLLFAVFGIKMLREGWGMSADEGKEELEEVQTDLRKRDDSYNREPLEGGGGGMRRPRVLGFVSRVFLQAFTLNVLAEWGDRSQIATVLMAAREDINGVIVGGLLGHFFCTALAVLGGRMIAMWISVRTVTLLGGLVFLLFAVSAFIIGP